MRLGWVYRHDAFYLDREAGELKAKFLVALAHTPAGDVVARLLTSRQHSRPEAPPCFHGDPYPGFFLGVPGGRLAVRTWVDLRALDNLDEDAVALRIRKGVISAELAIPPATMRPLLECVAAANDTTPAAGAVHSR